jgi:hypothetical protein
MKKTIQLVGVIFALAILSSCYKSPDLGGLSNELVVATDRDLEIDFTDARLTDYYISDSILRIGGKLLDDTYIIAPQSDDIINRIVAKMDARGFNRLIGSAATNPLGRSDIAIITTAISITNTGQNCYGGYPGWGWYGGGYYPYCTSYKYDTGNFTIEMVDKKATPEEVGKLNLIWTNINFGVLNSNDNINEDRALESIDQAFEQSPYITK